MNGFEAFDIRAWVLEGLTRHIAASKVSRRAFDGAATQRKSKTLIAATACTVVAAAMQLALPLTLTASTPDSVPLKESPMRSNSFDLPDGLIASPSSYWSSLMAEIGQWKRLEESALPNPPTFI